MKFRIIYDWEKQGLEIEAEYLEAAKAESVLLGYNPLDGWKIPSELPIPHPHKEVIEDWQSTPYDCSLGWFSRVYG